MFKKVDPKQSLPQMEDEILKFWDENQTFQKSIKNRKDAPDYVFYDGPPFATGTPHYGHIVASAMKDIVPRYWTMRGKKVERKWGWDCHGLPIENIAEKELGIVQKKEIEEMGVKKFNDFCRSKVFGYVEDWKKVIRRLGRWADMNNSYKTMDLDFMESIWWVFKQLWDKGLIYEGHRSMHVCPRCETTLSQSEVAEGYRDIKDLSATVKFELVDEPGTYILAWTTTPWTLIGNVALAVGEDIDYVKAKCTEKENEDDYVIVAKDRFEVVEDTYHIVKEFKGQELVGKKYVPLMDYYAKDEKLLNRENGWQVYAGDFVTTGDGTGVVHIAPAFGDDDLQLGKKHNLPFVQHLGMDGVIKPEATDFAGLHVKPKDDHQKTDVEVIKYLAHHGQLFAKEQYGHSYPHCWRCDTPLLNYATSSWFVSITKIKEQMLEHAKGVHWTPDYIKEGRFGNWLTGARDWSISRQRYWASVMPIWKCEKCDEMKVVGSIEEIREPLGNPNRLFLVRHGEAENSVQGILSSYPEKVDYHLTEMGREQIKEAAEQLREEKVSVIFSSPIRRTQETAQIIADTVGATIVIDERIRETDMGAINGESSEKWPLSKSGRADRNECGVETMESLDSRLRNFLEDINQQYQGKNIVVVSHGDPLRTLSGICTGRNIDDIAEREYPKMGSLAVNYSKVLDLHKDSVDSVKLPCKCGGEMTRIPDVLDCWFESGSMPYAQVHYPFENKEKFEASFPAEFIAEGIDQTRAWFYYLHAIASGIKDSPAFKNVVVNGMVLAADGKKMSKKLKNYPDPMEVVEKYGADALRMYLATSPVMAAENLNFNEKEVSELTRGLFRMLWNSYSFFVMYANIDGYTPATRNPQPATNLLDRWIISELNMLIKNVNEKMEAYDLVGTARLFQKFADDLSNWYVRRSRKRFWKSENDGDKNEAYATLHHVLVTLAKLMAPFAPFMSEEIYKNLTGEESVHLSDFPVADEKLIDEKLNGEMRKTRDIITEALQKRSHYKIKVRQPLSKVIVKYSLGLPEEYYDIIKDEVNVKEVEYIIEGVSSGGSAAIMVVDLDKEITDELKLEGQAREVIRCIQEMRKEAGYDVENHIQVAHVGADVLFAKFGELVAKEVLAEKNIGEGVLDGADLTKDIEIDGDKITLSIKR
ncbi:isoleucine--tRNA ligase [Patescibacteria group bacterium]|nr:MAG: isoleucine--tRNA ligase [Patescibacteria group bacterium]